MRHVDLCEFVVRELRCLLHRLDDSRKKSTKPGAIFRDHGFLGRNIVAWHLVTRKSIAGAHTQFVLFATRIHDEANTVGAIRNLQFLRLRMLGTPKNANTAPRGLTTVASSSNTSFRVCEYTPSVPTTESKRPCSPESKSTVTPAESCCSDLIESE